MSSSFAASLTFEGNEERNNSDEPGEPDDWLLERKVKIFPGDDWSIEDDVGDSCCFGTRTVEIGSDCIWRLHGGV